MYDSDIWIHMEYMFWIYACWSCWIRWAQPSSLMIQVWSLELNSHLWWWTACPGAWHGTTIRCLPCHVFMGWYLDILDLDILDHTRDRPRCFRHWCLSRTNPANVNANTHGHLACQDMPGYASLTMNSICSVLFPSPNHTSLEPTCWGEVSGQDLTKSLLHVYLSGIKFVWNNADQPMRSQVMWIEVDLPLQKNLKIASDFESISFDSFCLWTPAPP